jgi:hypothetical protein
VYQDTCELSSVSARYKHDLVEAGVGGTANPSISCVYSIFGADFVSLLGINLCLSDQEEYPTGNVFLGKILILE